MNQLAPKKPGLHQQGRPRTLPIIALANAGISIALETAYSYQLPRMFSAAA